MVTTPIDLFNQIFAIFNSTQAKYSWQFQYVHEKFDTWIRGKFIPKVWTKRRNIVTNYRIRTSGNHIEFYHGKYKIESKTYVSIDKFPHEPGDKMEFIMFQMHYRESYFHFAYLLCYVDARGTDRFHDFKKLPYENNSMVCIAHSNLSNKILGKKIRVPVPKTNPGRKKRKFEVIDFGKIEKDQIDELCQLDTLFNLEHNIEIPLAGNFVNPMDIFGNVK